MCNRIDWYLHNIDFCARGDFGSTATALRNVIGMFDKKNLIVEF